MIKHNEKDHDKNKTINKKRHIIKQNKDTNNTKKNVTTIEKNDMNTEKHQGECEEDKRD